MRGRYKLENGKFVVPGPIEDGVRLSSMFIAQAFVHGANKKHNVILIVPDFAACAVHLHLEGDDAKPANMVKDQRVRDLIQNDLDYASKSMKRYRTLDGWRWPRFSHSMCAATLCPRSSA